MTDLQRRRKIMKARAILSRCREANTAIAWWVRYWAAWPAEIRKRKAA